MTPEQANDMRKMDEALTFMSDNYPRLWKRLFDNSVKEGFTEAQAMELLKTLILSMGRSNST